MPVARQGVNRSTDVRASVTVLGYPSHADWEIIGQRCGRETHRLTMNDTMTGSEPSGHWRWTLNWDQIRDDLTIGSCPMTPDDIDTVKARTAASALLSVQHDECLQHWGIDYGQHVAHGERVGLTMARAPMRDFDPQNQRRRLPVAVRALGALLCAGHRVYVHCTAGLNRAPLTVLGYLTFVEGRGAEDAVAMIRNGRADAAPSWEAYWACRQDLVALHRERIERRAWQLHTEDVHADATTNWCQAEREIVRDAVSR